VVSDRVVSDPGVALPQLRWRRLRLDGATVVYGDGGAGLPVVFLHGWGLSGRTYRAALEGLLAHPVRVLAPALPGFGGSSPLPAAEATLAGYADVVARFCRAVVPDEPVVLMGHSFGGGVAIVAAHRHPELVRSLVLINSIGGSAWRRDGSILRSMAERPLWDWGLHFPADVMPLRQVRRVLPVILSDLVPNVVRNPRAFWHAAGLARTADLTAELEELKRREVPIVVLWGERDEVITRASFDALCAAVGEERCVTVPGSHSWLLAEPDRFVEVITNVIGVAERAGAPPGLSAAGPPSPARPPSRTAPSPRPPSRPRAGRTRPAARP
jgi:pimeloyl-ACP methyl ester carboxylesterase